MTDEEHQKIVEDLSAFMIDTMGKWIREHMPPGIYTLDEATEVSLDAATLVWRGCSIAALTTGSKS